MVGRREQVILTGGPHSGKTTLLNHLHHRYPSAYFVPEPATRLIESETTLETSQDGYIPNVPWIDYDKFGRAVAQESVDLEAAIPPGTELVFQDRSLIDTIAYARYFDCEHLIPDVDKLAKAAGYTLALFCHPVGDYTNTDVRQESPEDAKRLHDLLLDAYVESGVEVYVLPDVVLAQRSLIVQEVMDKRGFPQTPNSR